MTIEHVASEEEVRRSPLLSMYVFGVVGRETGGVGGTSPIASARSCRASTSISKAASPDIAVMSHCALEKPEGLVRFLAVRRIYCFGGIVCPRFGRRWWCASRRSILRILL